MSLGLLSEVAAPNAKPCVFLDRDGTLIVERHYLGDPDGVELETTVPEGLRRIQALGYILIVVSNQAGIGRGILKLAQVEEVNSRTDALLRAEGVQIQAWYHCPHEPHATCACRKPAPGMIIHAQSKYAIDMSQSLVVGDKNTDLELARNMNLRGHLVRTGYGRQHEQWARANDFEVHDNLGALAANLQDYLKP